MSNLYTQFYLVFILYDFDDSAHAKQVGPGGGAHGKQAGLDNGAHTKRVGHHGGAPRE